MDQTVLVKLKNFNYATKFPCVAFNVQKQEIACYHSSVDATVRQYLQYSNFHLLRKKLNQENRQMFVAGAFGNLRFLLLPVYGVFFQGSVVVGPFLRSPAEQDDLCMQQLPVVEDLSELNCCGKMLFSLLNPASEYEKIESVFVESSFNPFGMEQYFVDSRDCLKDYLNFLDMSAVFEELNTSVLTKDVDRMKRYLQQIIGIQFPEPARAQRVKLPWSDLRVKKNIIICFFSVLCYIAIQQKWNSSFFIYFNSLITTEFEKCRNETELMETCFEMIDHMFSEMVSDQKCENKQIREACFYICENLSQKLSLATVSAYVGLSEKYFSKLFKQEMEISFKDYVDRAKITYSKNLLRYTKKTVSEIGIAISVEPASNFASYFKKHVGMTPSEYRNAEFG